jgi:hypothetical protein
MPLSGSLGPRRRWRDYRTASGRRPVKEALDELSDMDLASVAAAMRDVREKGCGLPAIWIYGPRRRRRVDLSRAIRTPRQHQAEPPLLGAPRRGTRPDAEEKIHWRAIG